MLWLQTAPLADELVPCARRVAATGRYACLVQHRRGYARSDPATPPGSIERDAADAVGLLEVDVPALLAWRFGADDAARITAPVLSVGGAESGPWFAQVRDWVRAILPHADEHVILGAGHDLALTHADEMAAAVAAFLDAHPLELGGAP